MKMKEVCSRTGLSERAVRLYCEEGLLTPIRTEMRGRVYLEFEESHITELQQIACLRSAGFSLEEIKTVLDEPHLIPGILESLRARLVKEQGEQGRILGALEEITDPPADAASLCRALAPREVVRDYSNGAVLRDEGPSFREFCERGGVASDGACDQLDRSVARGRVVMLIYAIWYWLSFGYSLLLAVSSTGGSLFALLVCLGIAVAVFIFFRRGVTWLRVVLAFLHAGNALFIGAGMADLIPAKKVIHSYDEFGNSGQWVQETGSWWLFALALLVLLVEVACVYFLCFNRWVSDYLYDRSTEY